MTSKQPDGSPKQGPALNVPGAEVGKLCVRFAPEPSGYLHIGHAKSALIDQYLKEQYDGTLILRFDDTNPALEDVKFEEAIGEDLNLLGVTPDRTTHSSDYFEQLEAACEKYIRAGTFYCDDTDVDTMREERNDGIESKCRFHTIEENVRRFNEMKLGSPEGLKNVVRAKLDMSNPNKCMRDFTVYRCVQGAVHHITGDKHKAYPMYDFCCPLIDAWEGITHALRSNEYSDRIPQYQWVQQTANELGIINGTSIVYEFSRLNLVNTCLSKRKLKWIVDAGLVDGWEDPRFPTIRGILRRGMRKEALLEFIIQQGASKNANLMEWDKIWAINRKILDPIAPRWSAVSAADHVILTINGCEYEQTERSLHPKNTDIGVAKQHRSNKVAIEQEDAASFGESEEFTLLKYSNVKVTSIEKNSDGKITAVSADYIPNGDFKKTKKVHWVPLNAPNKPPTEVLSIEYDHIIVKKKIEADDEIEQIVNRESMQTTVCLLDPEAVINENDVVQFERRGLFRCDGRDESGKLRMIQIPEGKTKAMSAHIKGKVDAEKLAKGAGNGGNVKPAKNAPKPQDDVTRIELKVGRIVEVWPHPDADKLWCEKIDVGNGEVRNIASGLRDFYSQEEMTGKLVIVVANLPERPLRGFKSHGMVLCASNADHTQVEFMQPPEGTPLGEILKFEGTEGLGPDEVLPKKKSPWDVCAPLFTVAGDREGFYKADHKLVASTGPVKCVSITEGSMS